MKIQFVKKHKVLKISKFPIKLFLDTSFTNSSFLNGFFQYLFNFFTMDGFILFSKATGKEISNFCSTKLSYLADTIR